MIQENPATLLYNNIIFNLNNSLKKIKKIIFFCYLARLITFLSFIAFLIAFFQMQFQFIYILLSVFSFVSFLVVIKLDYIYFFREKFTSYKIQINKNELEYINHQYKQRFEGEEYNKLNPHLTADFDIFGKGSLFQYLNRSATLTGRNKFAQNLCQSEHNKNTIISKQEAIKELSEKNDFIQDFRTLGMFKTENGSEFGNLQLWMNEKSSKIRVLKVLNIFIPLFNISWIILIILNVIPIGALVLPILVSLITIQRYLKKINESHAALDKSTKVFEKYASLIKHIENENFKSTYLSELQQKLFNKHTKASKSLTTLFKILNGLDLRANLFVSILLNTLLLFDLQIYMRLILWKEKHKTDVYKWFEVLAEIDSLMNFATFHFNNKTNVLFPKLSSNEFELNAVETGHPLIHPETRVNNTIHFQGKPNIIIVTGANMAGKSTFLRTLSINLILAMNGAPVCAREFEFTPCDIMSSIKIQDSLSNNESYFYAELLRLKEILDHVKIQPHTLVVFDEILRGTNTKDKQLGSIGILEKLISLNATVIISTHDLIIGELEKTYPEIVSNFCFEIELQEEKLLFDYKLKKGISQKLNASFLMKKLEITN